MQTLEELEAGLKPLPRAAQRASYRASALAAMRQAVTLDQALDSIKSEYYHSPEGMTPELVSRRQAALKLVEGLVAPMIERCATNAALAWRKYLELVDV